MTLLLRFGQGAPAIEKSRRIHLSGLDEFSDEHRNSNRQINQTADDGQNWILGEILKILIVLVNSNYTI